MIQLLLLRTWCAAPFDIRWTNEAAGAQQARVWLTMQLAS